LWSARKAVKKSPEFLAALKKRGVTDVSLVMVDPWSAGDYGVESAEDKKKRLFEGVVLGADGAAG